MTSGGSGDMTSTAALAPDVARRVEYARAGDDTRAMWTPGIACLLVYAWFYQGPGFNQHSHFATVRALVEHGTFEISPYAETTWDVGRIDGRVYSNKAPGLALYSVGPYFLLYHVERMLGWDPSAERVGVFNLYVLTVWASAVPATGAVLAIFVYLRRFRGVDTRASMLLAAAYAFGTLALPHSGAMMAHNFVALCLLLAWMLLEVGTTRAILGMGLLLGMASITEHLAAPVTAIYLVALLLRRPTWRRFAAFCVGPAAALVFILCYNAVHFGKLLTTNYAYTDWSYRSPDLLMGVLGWPAPRVLWWITFHPHRGIFYACPLLLLALMFPWSAGTSWRDALRRHLVPIGVIAYFVLFNTSFYGWSGGWGVGPRYTIPGMPFLFILATYAALRWPKVAAVLAAVSILNMFTVASVCLMVPSRDYGPPMRMPDGQVLDPIVECYRRLFSWREIAMHHGSFNLGQKLGMPGLSSLLPPLAAIVACFGLAWREGGHRPSDVP